MRLSLDNVSVAFGRVRALDGVGFDVGSGERIAVIGSSGAGKSTLFGVLTRRVDATGKVEVGGRNLYSMPKRELKETRRKVGVIHQAYNLVPQLSAGMNASLGELGGMGKLGSLRTFLTGPNPELSKRVGAALERVGLSGKEQVRTMDLSGGQQQRVAVARLLVQRPGLVLADEPFAAVDPVTESRVFDALMELNGEGSTLVFTLHDVDMARRFPRVVALKDGNIIHDGPPETLTEEKLKEVYAGDSRQAGEPEEQRPMTPRAEGIDGVAAH